MKKTLSVILAVLMALSCLSAVAFAADDKQYEKLADTTNVPVVVIRGDGEDIYDEDGNQVYTAAKLLDAFKAAGDGDDDGEDNELLKSVINILYPFIVKGIAFNDWNPYYEALQTEVAELFEKSLFDENGDPMYGTGIAQWKKDNNERLKHTNLADAKGNFKLTSEYRFSYDWRLDPLAVADELKDFIDGIKQATGCDKVCILANCLGGVVAAAYVAKYGMDDLKGVGLEATVLGGSSFISEAISGKLKIDPNAISRMLVDLEARDRLSLGENSNIILSTLDLLDKSGVFETVKGVSKELIYYKLVEGVTSALSLSTAFTYPGYWACVCPEDYEVAKEYVFGKEGSEKRIKYAGLIEKIDNYDVMVRQNIDNIVKKIDAEGNLAVEARYGYQHVPIGVSCDEPGDQLALARDASFGATTSNIYSTLDSKYIEKRQAEGLGKYISPDKMIDASTCAVPEKTWFIKGLTHMYWPSEPRQLLTTVIASDKRLTVDDFKYSQFMVFNYNPDTCEKMTTSNFHTENWDANINYDKPTNGYVKLVNFLKSLFDWFRALLGKIFK